MQSLAVAGPRPAMEKAVPRASNDKVLVIGYGNPGRKDDGLGPALATSIERLDLPGVTVDSGYQLSVEDAAAVAEHDVVVFADATCTGDEAFSFQALEPGEIVTFSTHSVQPAGVLALARELFAAYTAGYVLAIRGYAFDEFGEGLSADARANLAAASEFIERVLRQRTFSECAVVPPTASTAAPAGDI